jgi:hypothetical protein
VAQGRANVGVEQGVAVPRGGFEFGVELHAHEPGVDAGGQFDDFGELFALGQCLDHQTGCAQAIEVVDIGFVAVAVALGDHIPIDLMRQGARLHV